MSLKKLGFATAYFFGAVAVIAASLYLWACNPFKLGAPNDAELIALFQRNRPAFESLRQMATEDSSVVSYIDGHSSQGNAISEGRRSTYGKLLKTVKDGLVVRVSNFEVSFSYWGGGEGLAVSRSWIKGIAYLPEGPRRLGILVKSLDTLPSADGTYFVPIDANWYLFYSQTE